MTQDLIHKLSEAGEGSRELDGDIERVLFPDALIMTDSGSVGTKARPAVHQPLSSVPQLSGDVIAECTGVSFYTTSLDAALALAERIVPNVYWGFQHNKTAPEHPEVLPFSAWFWTEETGEIEGMGQTFALAAMIGVTTYELHQAANDTTAPARAA